MDATEQLLLMLRGVSTTLSISILSFLTGLALGLVLAFTKNYGGRSSQILVDFYEKIFRGIPELVLIFLFYFGLGYYFPSVFKNAFFTATFALGLRSAANQCQIFKTAIRGVGEEQMVAARSLGLSKLHSIVYVMVPQIFIFSTPGLGSEYALLVKDSSYAYLIGALEIMFNTWAIRKATGDNAVPFLLAALLYVLLTFPIATWLDTWGSRKKKQLGL